MISRKNHSQTIIRSVPDSYSNVVKNSPDFWLKRFKPDLMGPLKTLKKIYSLRFIALITLDDKSSSTCVMY